MKAMLKRLRKLDNDELLAVSEAVDIELSYRMERADTIPDSARRRAVQRQHSYRSRYGASAPPVRVVGLREAPRRRLAA
jgi:hypothetical protein